MDELFGKERTLCNLSCSEVFHKVFLESLGIVQSRKVADVFLERVEQGVLEISEVFWFIQECSRACTRFSSYVLHRIRKKFNGLRLVKYVIAQPLPYTHTEEIILKEFIDVLEITLDEKQKIAPAEEVVQIRIGLYVAKKSKFPETEIEIAVKLIKRLKNSKNNRKQEYLEEIVDLVYREIENREFVRAVKKEIETGWPYEKSNPAQKVLLALTEQEPCPYENIKTRRIEVHRISPFFMRDKETMHLLNVIFCIERTIEENNEIVGQDMSRMRFIQCTLPDCQKRINTEHIRYYLIHKLRIKVEMDKLLNETLLHHTKETEIVGQGIMHLKKYQSTKYLNYIVNSIRKADKIEQKTDVKRLKSFYFSVLKHFPMYGANEESVLSLAKAACSEVAKTKVLLALNILYAVRGTKKIGFATALLAHELIKKENSFYTNTVICAISKKHSEHLKSAKELILDHFLYRSADELSVALETLHKLYGYSTVKEFIDREKYYMAPRLWQKRLFDQYYEDSVTFRVYYAIYVCQMQKHSLEKSETQEYMRRSIAETKPEALPTIFISLKNPKEMFSQCQLEAKEIFSGYSLMSILFTTRKILEDRVAPVNNCLFSLMHFVFLGLFADVEPSTHQLQEIFMFLVHTEKLRGSPKCCDFSCTKESFFNLLINKISRCDLIHYKYMIAQELTSAQKKKIEELAGEDKSLYLENACTVEEAVVRIYPYLKLRSFFAFLSIKKILPLILSSAQKTIHELTKTHWQQVKPLIISLCRMYIDRRDEGLLDALSYFGLHVIDALEEGHDKTDVFLDESIGLIHMEHKSKKEIVQSFIATVLIPIYYETLDDLLLYIIQELLKDEPLNSLEEHTEFIMRLQGSKYIIEIDPDRLSEIKQQKSTNAYRRGISHKCFLIELIKILAELPEKGSIFPILENTVAILDTLAGKKWPQRHQIFLLQFHLFLLMYSLKPLGTEVIRDQFSPLFKDVRGGALVDSDILRTVISSSLCMDGIFTEDELSTCARYIQERHFTIRILEGQLRKCTSEKKDMLLTQIQEEYLKIKEKDVVFGINAVINKLSPVNLAAEMKINNEHANYIYLNKEILRCTPRTTELDAKYKELFESLNNTAVLADTLEKAEKSIQQWAHTVPLYSFSKDPDSLKSFLIDAHILQDCRILQQNALPDALKMIKDRRETCRTYEALRVSEIHRQIIPSLPKTAEVIRAEKDALLCGVRIARKSGQCELSEKLLIWSILKDDWRVFYEKAKIHLLKNNKTLAKQALQRLMDNLPAESKYEEKAIFLNTEIEQSEEIYKIALSQLKTNEKLYFSYGKYVEKKQPVLAFKMFCKALDCGETKAAEIVPKLIHWITDTSKQQLARESITDCVSEMTKTLQNVDIKIFRRFYIQVLTRLCHKEKCVEILLSKIALKLIEKFPEESSWRTISMFMKKNNNTVSALLENTPFSFRKLFFDVITFTEVVGRIIAYPANSGMVHIPTILGESLAVPKGIPAPFDDFLSEIVSVSNIVFVFPTLQKPRKIETLTSTGCYKSFLCKANDDLRKDAGFMDLNMLLNSLFQSDNAHRMFNIRVYTVVPITEKMGIIEFVENLDTLKNICDKLYEEKGISIKEIGAAMGFVKKITTLGKALPGLLEKIPPVFSEYFLRQFTRPIDWLQARKRYIITYAVMNGVGYLMGLGDRHCENILFDGKTGETVHVDLNCIFDKGLTLAVPETVPFRLTQNIIDAFGPTKEEGQYKLALERVLKFLSLNKDLIVANLLGFVHDPLGEWTGRNNTKTAIQIIEKTKKKIDFDDEITKCSILIETSRSLEALGKMYVWWLPFI